jgi:hypothetical protein
MSSDYSRVSSKNAQSQYHLLNYPYCSEIPANKEPRLQATGVRANTRFLKDALTIRVAPMSDRHDID